MNAKSLIPSIIVLFIVIIVAGLIAFNGHSAAPGAQINATATGGQNINSSKTLFSSTQYSQYAYQVYPGPMSQQAQSALAGFNITSFVLPNNTAKVTLTFLGTNQNQSIALRPNYKLYIIETTFGDDGFHFDSSLGDDGFVVVDPNGYVA